MAHFRWIPIATILVLRRYGCLIKDECEVLSENNKIKKKKLKLLSEMCGGMISLSSEVKNLGIFFDSKFDWKKNIETLPAFSFLRGCLGLGGA